MPPAVFMLENGGRFEIFVIFEAQKMSKLLTIVKKFNIKTNTKCKYSSKRFDF